MNIHYRVSLAVFTATLFYCQLVGAENPSSEIDASTPDQTPTDQTPANPAGAGDNGWHTDATFYLWLPGVHGDYRAFGYNLGFKASPGELLSHADLGLMGLLGVRHKRLVILSDLVWTPLTITKTQIFDRLPSAPVLSAEVKYTQFFLTPEIGYRILDHKRVKVDGLAGFRYWHQGTTLITTFTTQTSQARSSVNTTTNWADPLCGARILLPLAPKLLVTILGDAGGWGAGSQLDYQMIGALTYRIRPKWALSAAWRYLYVDYATKAIDSVTAQSGIVFGVTYSINPSE